MKFRQLFLAGITLGTGLAGHAQDHQGPETKLRDCTIDAQCRSAFYKGHRLAQEAHGLIGPLIDMYLEPAHNQSMMLYTPLSACNDIVFREIALLRQELEAAALSAKQIADDLKRVSGSGFPRDKANRNILDQMCHQKPPHLRQPDVAWILTRALDEARIAARIEEFSVSLWRIVQRWAENAERISKLSLQVNFSMADEQLMNEIIELRLEWRVVEKWLKPFDLEQDMERILHEWVAHGEHARKQKDHALRESLAVRLACMFLEDWREWGGALHAQTLLFWKALPTET